MRYFQLIKVLVQIVNQLKLFLMLKFCLYLHFINQLQLHQIVMLQIILIILLKSKMDAILYHNNEVLYVFLHLLRLKNKF